MTVPVHWLRACIVVMVGLGNTALHAQTSAPSEPEAVESIEGVIVAATNTNWHTQELRAHVAAGQIGAAFWRDGEHRLVWGCTQLAPRNSSVNILGVTSVIAHATDLQYACDALQYASSRFPMAILLPADTPGLDTGLVELTVSLRASDPDNRPTLDLVIADATPTGEVRSTIDGYPVTISASRAAPYQMPGPHCELPPEWNGSDELLTCQTIAAGLRHDDFGMISGVLAHFESRDGLVVAAPDGTGAHRPAEAQALLNSVDGLWAYLGVEDASQLTFGAGACMQCVVADVDITVSSPAGGALSARLAGGVVNFIMEPAPPSE